MPRADGSDPLLTAFVAASSLSSSPSPSNQQQRPPSTAQPWSHVEVTEAASVTSSISAMTEAEPLALSVEDPQSRLHWSALPPMPSPHYAAMRSQACGGVSVVMCIIGMCVGGTHFFVQGLDGTPFIFLSAAVYNRKQTRAVACVLEVYF